MGFETKMKLICQAVLNVFLLSFLSFCPLKNLCVVSRSFAKDLGFLLPLAAAGKKVQVFCGTRELMNNTGLNKFPFSLGIFLLPFQDAVIRYMLSFYACLQCCP